MENGVNFQIFAVANDMDLDGGSKKEIMSNVFVLRARTPTKGAY